MGIIIFESVVILFILVFVFFFVLQHAIRIYKYLHKKIKKMLGIQKKNKKLPEYPYIGKKNRNTLGFLRNL